MRQGGINGSKINLISLDDSLSPSKTVEQTRRLIEQEQVAFIFGNPGTASNAAIRSYLNDNKVPQLFVASGDSMFGDPQHYPWTIGLYPELQERSAQLRQAHPQDQARREDRLAVSKGRVSTRLSGRASRRPWPDHATMIVKEVSYEVVTTDSRFADRRAARLGRGHAHHRRNAKIRGAGHPQGL